MAAPLDCNLCPALCAARKNVVNGEGVENPLIVMVGEGPGEVEDARRRPFIGPSGKVLKVLEWAAGITPDITYHTNATRCWGKRNPKAIEIDSCHNYLIEEIRDLRPAVVVALGGAALRSLYRKGVTIRSVMGFSLYHDDLPGIPIIPTYHPSYLMRKNWNDAALVIAHFRKAKRIADAGGQDLKLGSYMGIENLADLRALRDYLLNDPAVKQIAVDTETTGLSWLDDELLCVSLSGEKGTGFSVPLMHRGEVIEMVSKGRGKNKTLVEKITYRPEPFWDLDEEMPEVLTILGEILGSPVPKSGQNISFDLRMLERRPDETACTALTAFGLMVNNVTDDTRLASQLLQETLPASLTVLTAYWTDMPYYEEEIAPFKSKMWELPDKVLWEYGGADVDVVQIVKPILLPKLKQEGSDWVYRNISIPLIRCSTAMEERGVRIDLEYFDRLCDYYRDKLGAKTGELTELVGREIDSPTYYANAQKLLFDELGFPLTKETIKSALTGGADGERCKKCKKDNPCSSKHAGTSTVALKELAERVDHPVLPVFIDIKGLEKFSSTFLDGGKSGGLRRHIRPDLRVHPRWNEARAKTGRFSCEEPNLMNPPKEIKIHDDKYGVYSDDAIRSMFIARDGYMVMNADWAQLEVWVLAYVTKDPTLLGLLLSGKDAHVYVARKLCELGLSSIFPQECWEPELSDDEWHRKYDHLRGKAKTFTFGLMYQLTEQGAADRLNCTIEESHLLFQAFLSQVFPSLPDFFNSIREEILTNFGARNHFGRWRHLAEVPILSALANSPRYRAALESSIRQGTNFPIQSGGHDLHTLAHIRQEYQQLGGALPVLEMHDSLMLETPASDIEASAWAVKNGWEDLAQNLILPNGEKLEWHIPVEVTWGRSFGDPEYRLTAGGVVEAIETEAA